MNNPISLNHLEKLLSLIKEIHDEADHALGTEADKPLSVMRIDLRAIRTKARQAVRLLLR
jgi:hypothetical protein